MSAAFAALVSGVERVVVSRHVHDGKRGRSSRRVGAEGLTIISRRGNETTFYEMVARRAKLFPNVLGRNPKRLKFVASTITSH